MLIQKIVPIVAIQNVLNLVLPFRAGEFSYVHMAHRAGIAIGGAVASLAVARAYDFMSAALLFFIAAMWVLGAGNAAVIAWYAVPFAAFSIGIIFLMSARRRWRVYLGGRFIRAGSRAREKNQKILAWLAATAGEFFMEGARLGSGAHFAVVVISFVLWVINFMIGFLLLRAAGVEIGIAGSMTAYGFPIFAVSAIPLPITGGFGVYEGSAAFGLMLIGIAREIAVRSALILHLQEQVFVVVFLIFVYGALLLFRGLRFYGK